MSLYHLWIYFVHENSYYLKGLAQEQLKKLKFYNQEANKTLQKCLQIWTQEGRIPRITNIRQLSTALQGSFLVLAYKTKNLQPIFMENQTEYQAYCITRCYIHSWISEQMKMIMQSEARNMIWCLHFWGSKRALN